MDVWRFGQTFQAVCPSEVCLESLDFQSAEVEEAEQEAAGCLDQTGLSAHLLQSPPTVPADLNLGPAALCPEL